MCDVFVKVGRVNSKSFICFLESVLSAEQNKGRFCESIILTKQPTSFRKGDVVVRN